MTTALRTLCLLLFALLGAFAPAVRAADTHCCAAKGHVTAAATIPGAARAAAGEQHCGCGANCQCAAAQPARDCGCHGKSPQPRPIAAPPMVPTPLVATPAAVERAARPAPPHEATASRLRAATASGLPHVLLPTRSRQEALSVWRC